MTDRTWASVTGVKENGVMSETGTGVLRITGKSGGVRGGWRLVTDENWALREVMLK